MTSKDPIADSSVIALSNSAIPRLRGGVPIPNYDRDRLRPRIAHFGVGAFHRAHQAFYLDRLLNAAAADDWGIGGVGILPADAAMKAVLTNQDYLYTLVAKAPSGAWDPRVVGSHCGYLFGPDDPRALVAQLADPVTAIVSLTITEGGYNVDQTTGEFISSNADVQAEVAGAPPRTAFGYLYEALTARKAAGMPAFTVMSCDNIQSNGQVARHALVAYARLRSREVADWIDAEVRFPSSMVDRITPRTTPEDIAAVAQRYGIGDGWPVVTEEFTQWVLEDDFPGGRPPFEDAGVEVVRDVEPYELMKLRLLNASHQGIAYFGWLAGYRAVHDAALDPTMAAFLLDYMHAEAIPTLRPLPGVDLDAYTHQLIARFANAEVRDTVARLAAESSDRIPKWLVPVIREQLVRGGDVRRSAAIVASWARYAEGTDEQGRPIDIVDRAEAQVREAAAAWPTDPLAFLRQESFFGELVDSPRFTEPYLWALGSLHERGAKATLETLAAL
ncbi:MAG: mannitol dehydrogenase family protein [Bifidobacteriaceae bacterium]|jgi:mannitol 2-dehydrogenase|nr:mannitol dehydrogenase family protein [Bifidobacteriaceae bacterium]